MGKPSNYRQRECTACGKSFPGTSHKCHACKSTDRECTSCGKTFRGTRNTCGSCQSIKRTCPDCDAEFKGKYVKCFSCRATYRNCNCCGTSFKGAGGNSICTGCRAVDRECASCGEVFKGSNRVCFRCRWNALTTEARAAVHRARSNARRARKISAQVSGPVPASVYAAIRAEGPCVYCGEPTEVVDHIVPLARGGREHEDNLVPACSPCNLSKHARLLHEWDADKVSRAILVSPKVAAAVSVEEIYEIGAL